MRSRWVIGMCAVVLSAVAFSAAAARAAARADNALLTIDDVLRAEDLGSAAFSPDGKWVAFERVDSIAGHPTFGFGNSVAVRSRVFVAARAGGEPKEIVGRAGARYRLAEVDTWAPDGQGLLLVETTNGVSRAVYWNAHSRKITQLPPRTSPRLTLVAWLNGRVLYTGVPDVEVGQRTSNRQMFEQIEKKWMGAWTTQEAQVTVSSKSPLFETTEPAAGTLILAEPLTGKAVKVADGDYLAAYLSPDGKRFAILRSAEDIPEPLSPFGRRTELQIFELHSGGATLVRQFADLDAGVGGVAWSSTGDRLLVGAKLSVEKKSALRLFQINAGSGARSGIALPEGLSLFDPDASFGGAALLPFGWIGDQPVVIAARKGAARSSAPATGIATDYGERQGLRFDLHAVGRGQAQNLTEFSQTSVNAFLAPPGADFALITADGAVWRIAPGAAPQRVSPQSAPPIMGFAVFNRNPFNPSPLAAYFKSQDQEKVALIAAGEGGVPQRRVLDLRSGELVAAGKNNASMQGGLQTISAPDLVAALSKVSHGWESSLVLDDGAERKLVAVNTALNDRAIAPVQRFTFKSGGRDLTGWIVLPPDAAGGKPAPAVVSIYGGLVYGSQPPASALPGLAPGPVALSGQLWAARGYAVIFPSAPVGAGADTDVMATLAEHAVSAVDAAAAKGWVDPTRVGVVGHSFGGFSVAAILAKRSDRFKAGVSMAGIYDYIYSYGTRALSQTLSNDGRDAVVEAVKVESSQIRLGKPFWKDPAPYIRNSPIFHVESINSPILLLHGDLDLGSTGLPAAERMYNALVRTGKTAALVHYWGEGHIIAQEGNIRDQWSRMTTWFDAHLQPAAAKPAIGAVGLDLTAGKPGVKPGDDFFAYANGRWFDSFQLPQDRAFFGPMQELDERSKQLVKEIIEQAANSQAAKGSAEQKIGEHFAAFLDQAGIEARGLAPARADLGSIEAAASKRDIARIFGLPGYASPISISMPRDQKNPDRYTAFIGQGRLGLPDREYYLKTDPKSVEIREQYVAYVEQLLTLGGVTGSKEKAQALVAFETALARVYWTIEKRRDVEASYNARTKAELIAYAPGFDWQAFLDAAELGTRQQFVLGELTAVRDIARLIERTPLQTLKTYLTFRYLSDHSVYLPKRFDEATFAFYGRTLRGQPQQLERWKRGVDQVNRALGEQVGQLYVAKHFPADSKAKMEELVANLRAALRERIDALPWMSPETKELAQDKLAAFITKIGYPDRWKDYSTLDVRQGDPLGNAQRARRWEWRYQLERLDKPVDRLEWFLTPQTVNAYYNPPGNEIVFPAAILQPPFFDPNADPAVNYGGIGAVIGHELGHGFDDQGRKFAADGSLGDWWTKADSAAFTQRASALITQYSAFEALPGLKVNGAITIGENIGDLGGLSMAYHAYKRSLGGKEAPTIDGLTGDQRFFLAWAQMWRVKSREAALRQQVMTDVHSPPYFRVNGVVRNMDAWYAAFGVKPGDKLYLKPEERVSIW